MKLIKRLLQMVINFFTVHKLQKIIALLMAVFVYMAVQYTTAKSIEFENVPVEVIPPPGCVLLNPEQTTVSLRVTGHNARLGPVAPSDFKLLYAMPPLPEGTGLSTHMIDVHKIVVRGPKLINAIPYSTRTIELKTDRVLTLEKTIKVTYSGGLPEDYNVAFVACPGTVAVTGPQSALSRVTDVRTFPLALDRTQSFDFSVSDIQMVMPFPGAKLAPQSVTVNVSYTRRFVNTVLTYDDLHFLTPPDFKGDIQLIEGQLPVKVELSTEPGVIIDRNLIMPFVDLSRARETSEKSIYEAPIDLRISTRRARLYNCSPEKVRIKVNVQE